VSTSGTIKPFPLTLMSASTSSHHARNPTLSDQAIMRIFNRTITRAFYDPPAITLLPIAREGSVRFGLALLASTPSPLVLLRLRRLHIAGTPSRTIL
jgi:hypothetical protein